MFLETKLYVWGDDVTSHRTILNLCISLVSCLFRRPRVPNYYNMSYGTQECSLFDDVTSHVTIELLYFACILLISKAKSAKLLQHVM